MHVNSELDYLLTGKGFAEVPVALKQTVLATVN